MLRCRFCRICPGKSGERTTLDLQSTSPQIRRRSQDIANLRATSILRPHSRLLPSCRCFQPSFCSLLAVNSAHAKQAVWGELPFARTSTKQRKHITMNNSKSAPASVASRYRSWSRQSSLCWPPQPSLRTDTARSGSRSPPGKKS